eukprot:s7263_g2.t1
MKLTARPLSFLAVALLIAEATKIRKSRKGRLECPPGPEPCTCNCASSLPHALSSIFAQTLPGGPPPPPTYPMLPAQPPPCAGLDSSGSFVVFRSDLQSSIERACPRFAISMATLYLIHQTGGQVLTFTPQSEGHTWQMTRMPPQQLSKVHIIMCFGEHGWQIKEGGAKIAADMPLTEQDPKQPPLGTWRSVTSGHAWTGTWILQDSKPESAPLPVWEPIVTPSISLQCRMEEASLVRVDLSLRSQPLTDQLVEEVFKAMRLGVQELAKRPDMTMVFSLHLQDAPIPSMRHVKRLLALSHEIGDLLFLVARGSAMVLHPHGFLGRGMVSIVRFIQAAAAAPWPDLVPTSLARVQAATMFLDPEPASAFICTAASVKEVQASQHQLLTCFASSIF